MTTKVEHSDLALDTLHGIVTWEYADSTERLAATGFVAGDVHKIAVDLDTDELFRLTNHDPITWKSVNVGGGLGDGFLFQNAIGDYAAKLHNLTAVTSPGAGDDELDGYAVGSYWVNTVLQTAYVCRKATAGLAVWVEWM